LISSEFRAIINLIQSTSPHYFTILLLQTKLELLQFAAMSETNAEPASSGVTQDGIKSILVEKLSATHIEISDLSGIAILSRVAFACF
jgi:hypothetical protein